MLKIINKKSTAVLIVAVFATALVMGPALLSTDSVFAKQKYKNWDDCRDDHSKNWCKEYFKKHDKDGGGNEASQAIVQSQVSEQNSLVVSGGDTKNSGNNFNFQNQFNKGNNALAQNNDDGGGNEASQAIVQSQVSEQNSLVVSGGDTKNSGNNFNFQNQENKGNNALAQQ